MLVVFLRHIRYFTFDVWWWVEIIQPFGVYASYLMVIGLLGLWARRFLVARIRYISAPSDHLMLALLLGIAGSGMMMKFVEHTDIIAVKAFFLSLMRFQLTDLYLPTDPILLIHLALVAILMIIYPISKLMHGPGIFFSPTRNQIDNSREKRHIAPWAKKLEE